jgi:hypothetical protein
MRATFYDYVIVVDLFPIVGLNMWCGVQIM